MKISIAMATYNGARYIKDQFQSFVLQTRRPDELVIVDDNSCDDTQKIITDFAKNAPFRVRSYINESTLGYSQNFGKALSLVDGDLIFLSDQDDIWYKNKIQAISMLANKLQNNLYFINNADIVDGNLNRTGLTKFGQIQTLGLSDDSIVMGCCTAIRKELLAVCLPIPDGVGSHDRWLAQFGTRLGGKHLVHEPLQLYRRHGNNSSNFIANRPSRVGRNSLLVSRLRRAFSNRGFHKNARGFNQLTETYRFISMIDIDRFSKWEEEFSDWKHEIESEVSSFEARKHIWKAPKYNRPLLILDSLIRGHYKSSREKVFKAMGSDLFD